MSKKILPLILLLLALAGGAFFLYSKKSATNETAKPEVQSPSDSFQTAAPLIFKNFKTELAKQTAPDGFTWYTCQNIPMAFLQPTGWFTLEEAGKGTEACFISKEKIEGPTGVFVTGLTVNVVEDVAQKMGESAPVYSQALMEEYQNMQEQGIIDAVGPIMELETQIEDPEVLVIAREASKGDHHFYYVNIANVTTDTLYVVSFEGKDPNWKDDFEKIGKQMLSHIAIDSGV